jgi:hypothetical protein
MMMMKKHFEEHGIYDVKLVEIIGWPTWSGDQIRGVAWLVFLGVRGSSARCDEGWRTLIFSSPVVLVRVVSLIIN